MTDREILLSLCASASLADHLGDIAEDIFYALKLAGIEVPDEVGVLDELGPWLGKELGTRTLYGTSFEEDAADDV